MDDRPRRGPGADRASIRPRRCRRGERDSLHADGCGEISWLQFGLDAVVEENEAVPGLVGQQPPASIRPRRCRRGEPGPPELGDGAEGASIRPRRCRRGEPHHARGRRRARELASIRPRRCRRGERRRPGRGRPAGRASIRPRRCRRGERTRRRGGSPSSPSFNSASTLSSRRTSASRRTTRRTTASFNSASTLSSRRTLRGRSAVRRGGRRFNSASTLSSRRTRPRGAPIPPRPVASIRPRRCRRGEPYGGSA